MQHKNVHISQDHTNRDHVLSELKTKTRERLGSRPIQDHLYIEEISGNKHFRASPRRINWTNHVESEKRNMSEQEAQLIGAVY